MFYQTAATVFCFMIYSLIIYPDSNENILSARQIILESKDDHSSHLPTILNMIPEEVVFISC